MSGEPQFEKLPSSGKTTAFCQWDQWGWENLSCHWGQKDNKGQQWRDQEKQKWLISSTHNSISHSELTNSVQGNAILIAGNRYSIGWSMAIPRTGRGQKPKSGNHSSGMFAVQREGRIANGQVGQQTCLYFSTYLSSDSEVSFPHFPSLSFSIFVPFYPFLCFIWVHCFLPLNNDVFNCKEPDERNLSLALALCLCAATKWQLDSQAITFVAGHRIALLCPMGPAS